MKKAIILAALSTIPWLMFLALIFVSNHKITEIKTKYEDKVGTSFIIESDTCTIVDYSTLNETFTLSNGKRVGASLVFGK